MDVLGSLLGHRIVPVVVLEDAARAGALAEALVAGGLPVAEVTLRTDEALDVISIMAERRDVLVGAGTVLRAEQVDQAVDAGAAYIVSPGSCASVVERARARGVPVLPGAVTATEIQAAASLDVSAVKFFPAATSGGPAAIKALAGPFPDVRFVPTGGITLTNMAEYLSIPSVVAVGGAWMVPGSALRAGDFELVKKLVREAVASLEDIGT